VRGEVTIDMPRPHRRSDARFEELVEHLYTIMTNPDMSVAGAAGSVPAKPVSENAVKKSPFSIPLPHARTGGISGLLELIAEESEMRQDVSTLAEGLSLSDDDLLNILEAAVLLGFATVDDGEVALTEIGRDFATTTILRSKDLFRQQLLANVPVIVSIVSTLRAKENKSMRAEFFHDLWDEHFPEANARKQFETAADWGRYAELFEYDAVEGELYLPEAAPEHELTDTR
jgi:NitT/TauT family transport system ATP-binding protein